MELSQCSEGFDYLLENSPANPPSASMDVGEEDNRNESSILPCGTSESDEWFSHLDESPAGYLPGTAKMKMSADKAVAPRPSPRDTTGKDMCVNGSPDSKLEPATGPAAEDDDSISCFLEIVRRNDKVDEEDIRIILKYLNAWQKAVNRNEAEDELRFRSHLQLQLTKLSFQHFRRLALLDITMARPSRLSSLRAETDEDMGGSELPCVLEQICLYYEGRYKGGWYFQDVLGDGSCFLYAFNVAMHFYTGKGPYSADKLRTWGVLWLLWLFGATKEPFFFYDNVFQTVSSLVMDETILQVAGKEVPATDFFQACVGLLSSHQYCTGVMAHALGAIFNVKLLIFTPTTRQLLSNSHHTPQALCLPLVCLLEAKHYLAVLPQRGTEARSIVSVEAEETVEIMEEEHERED